MKQILVYGDSLSWGIIPETRCRLPFDQRWPGILEGLLNAGKLPGPLADRLADQRRVRIIEDCLNGRRTVFDDPYKPGRNGLVGLAQRIEINSPLALVILLLGTNDFQSMHPHVPWHAAQGVATLVAAIRQAPIEPGMPVPPVLIVAPPPMNPPRGQIAPKFVGGDRKSVGLAAALRDMAAALGCPFFDAGSVIASSPVDGVHLDADQHRELATALAAPVANLLAPAS